MRFTTFTIVDFRSRHITTLCVSASNRIALLA